MRQLTIPESIWFNRNHMTNPKVRINDIALVPVDQLRPHPKNPNKHPSDQIERLAQIIEYQGWRYPIKVSRLSGFITSGHGRLAAAKLKGWSHAPVSYQEYESPEQELADLVADNSIAEWADLDLKIVNDMVPELGPDFDIDLLGIKDFTIDASESHGCDDDDIPENSDTICKPGDIWQLGSHRLMCGDSTDITQVNELMNGEMADFTITSPPYNVGLDYNSYDDEKSEQQYESMLISVMENCRKIATENYWILWNVGVYPLSLHLHLHLHLLRQFFVIRRSIAWIKQGITGPPMMYHMQKNPVVKNYQPNFGWEIIACCHINEKVFGDRRIPREIMDECMTDVWQVSQHVDSRDQGKHPGAFPVAIPFRAISLYAQQNVFEPFTGSGSTLIACEKSKRTFFGMELDAHYVDVAVARWEKYTGQKAERIQPSQNVIS